MAGGSESGNATNGDAGHERARALPLHTGLHDLFAHVRTGGDQDLFQRHAIALFIDAHPTELEQARAEHEALLTLVRDLGLRWRNDAPDAHPAGRLPPREASPVVVIGHAGREAATDPAMDALIDLARSENPGAPIIGCGGWTGAAGDPRIDHAGFALCDALKVAARAYTVSAAGGMDALIHGVPLSVTGAPLYAGWGFTDDRAPMRGRRTDLTFGRFFTALCLLRGGDVASLRDALTDLALEEETSGTARAGAARLIALSHALSQQGRRAEARKRVEDGLANAPDGTLTVHAMRMACATGDAAWAEQLLTLARTNGFVIEPKLEKQILLCAGDWRGALESERLHAIDERTRIRLGERQVDTLEALVADRDRTLLVALTGDLADDIRRAALLAKLIAACRDHSLSITCDPRAHGLLSRAFPQAAFIPCARMAETRTIFDDAGWKAALAADRVALITDIAPDLTPPPEAFDSRPRLKADPARVARWRRRLKAAPRPLVGIAWSAGRGDATDAARFSVAQVMETIAGSEAGFVSLQPHDDAEQLRRIEAAHPGRMIHFPTLAVADDIEETAALMACLDVVVSSGPLTLVLAAASGRPTWCADPALASRHWGRAKRRDTDDWFGTMVHVDGPRSELARRLRDGIAGLADIAAHETALEQADRLLAGKEPALEARSFAYRRRILDLDTEVLAPRLHRDARYWTYRARIHEKLGVRRHAARFRALACAQTATPSLEHLAAHWQAQVRIGRPDLAERFGPVDIASLNDEELRLGTEIEKDRISHDHADRALTLMAGGRRAEVAEELRRAVAASCNDNAESAAVLNAVTDRFSALSRFAPSSGPRRNLIMRARHMPDMAAYARLASPVGADMQGDAPRSVFCAGYMFSGSGALVDYLRQSARAIVPGLGDGEQKPFDTELNVFRRFYGVQHLLDAPQDELGVAHLGEFLMGAGLGLLGHPYDLHRLDLSRKRSLRGAFESVGRMGDLEALCQRLLDDVESGEGPDGEVILRAARNLCNALPGLFAAPGRNVVVWNNCIQAHNARTLAVLDRARLFAVARDPRDQFVSQCYEWPEGVGVNTVRRFISRTRHQQKLRAQLGEIPGLKARVMDVRFEAVVTDETTRRAALDFAGLATGDFEDGRHFNPDMSARNIGIHRTFRDRKAIDAIAEAFPRLLWND